MMKKKLTAVILMSILTLSAIARREQILLKDGWQFSQDSIKWKSVSIPHDWAIYGPFDRDNDLQKIAVEQNNEVEETYKTGRTGGLPFVGKGFYKKEFEITDTANMQFTLIFDGAMSNAVVNVNDKYVGGWAYGYNSFYIQIPAGLIKPGKNKLSVNLENKEQSSRWYPGAGLYRNVKLLITDKVHIPVWGTYLTTPHITEGEATVHLITKIEGAEKGQIIEVNTSIIAPDDKTVASEKSLYHANRQSFVQNFMVNNPQLWSPESPNIYKAVTTLNINGAEIDRYVTPFGIRKLEYLPEKGFFLNGNSTKFKGVCMHHDSGPLGAATNRAAIRRQIELLKDIGVNAIRTSHNMPDPQLVELCDEMGIMLMIEAFDDWGFRPKCLNGYGSIFREWAEKDMVNMLHQYRNNPSVVMWSIGNEVPDQWGPDGIKELEFLQGICHSEDPTRPVTCGMDQATATLNNGFASALDIPGFNYKPQFYKEAYNTLPQKIVLGTETASTVSSRGVYHFPTTVGYNAIHPDHQSSGYDTEFCFWSNLPDLDFAADEDYPWMIGQFVWTGFDYIGEPSPYDTDSWPSHSSLFGIFDLASLPKDRAFLYRSVWNTNDATLHLLPHWTWPGREGEITPVMVYTSWPKAELFVNGISQGIREKAVGKDIIPDNKTKDNHYPEKSDRQAMDRYRLVWDDIVYNPGEIRVVAYDNDNNVVGEKVCKTAGKPDRLILNANRTDMIADGEDLVYITVQIVDYEGNIVPQDNRTVDFRVTGAGKFRACANGDPTSLRPFHLLQTELFSGAATAIVQSDRTAGKIIFEAKAKGVKSAKLELKTH